MLLVIGSLDIRGLLSSIKWGDDHRKATKPQMFWEQLTIYNIYIQVNAASNRKFGQKEVIVEK